MNLLTERLLAEGFTEDYHPPNVRAHIGTKNFMFTYQYLCSTVWETPCGLLEKGSRFSNGSTSTGGITYQPENGNPLGSCPYKKERPCPHLIPSKYYGNNCVFHYTRRPFDYEQSCQKLEDAWDALRLEARNKAWGGYGPCYCFDWDYPSRSYQPRYWVENCINGKCKNPVCAVTRKERDLEQVNIYYDLLRVTRYRIGFADCVDKSLEKGLRQFKHPVARTDAEIWLQKNCAEGLRLELNREDRTNTYFSEMHGEEGFGEYAYYSYTATAQNIRIVRRSGKDLLQDLRDAEAGIKVSHASDLKKEAAAAKRKRKEDRKDAKQRKAERSSINTWLHMLETGEMPDGGPCSEVLLKFAKKELDKRGLLEAPTQISLWGA